MYFVHFMSSVVIGILIGGFLTFLDEKDRW